MGDITRRRYPYSPIHNRQVISRQAHFTCNSTGNKLWCKRSNCEASITIEAALLLPMVLLLFLFFVFMIHASVVVTSLQSAVMNTVKQVAVHMYPIELMTKKRRDASDDPNSFSLRKPPAIALKMVARQFVEQFSNVLPPPINQWVSDDVGVWVEKRVKKAGERGQAYIGEAFIKPLLVQYGIQGTLRAERIRITQVQLPDIVDKKEPYIAIEVEYDLPLRVPFLFKTITIAARASERVWIGDGPQSGRANPCTDGGKKESLPQLVSLVPDPLLPGRKAKLIAKVRPNERVELIVYYKSGKSKAKYVGWVTADAGGNASWQWHVSGNTTLGTWRLVVHTENGCSVERQFTVK